MRRKTMNELQLSNDLDVITAEINSYKQVAGQSIFEIGRRLKHVKENDLVHGEFGKWLNEIDMSNQQESRIIKVYEEIPNSKISHVGKVSFRALYEIATLPKGEREKEHVTSKGETKTVDEMTVRELEELKRKNRETEQAKEQAEKQAEQARKSEKIIRKKLENLEDREPKVIEKEIIKEVDKTDYDRVRSLEEQIKRMKANDRDVSEKEKEVKLLQLDASKSVLKTKITIDDF